MNRKIFAFQRVVVCVSKSTVTVLSDTSEGLLINRVNPMDIEQISYSPSDEHSPVKALVTGLALVGYLQLSGGMYLGVITKAVRAAFLGEHEIFAISEIQWVPVSFGLTHANTKHLSHIDNLFRGSDFFFSHSLNLDGGERFRWNQTHSDAFNTPNSAWSVSIIHGSVRSVAFSCLGRAFELCLIGRRSRHFAGTRYRKRGINWAGACANEVETEQILVSFGPPDTVMSFKQIRASVPLRWTQESHGLIPKPEVLVRHDDLRLEATQRHFAQLLARYQGPVHAVSLLTQRAGSAEAPLGTEYLNAVEYLRETQEMDIELIEFDLKAAANDVPGQETQVSFSMYVEASRHAHTLAKQTRWTVQCNEKITEKQLGIVRTNCLDCLDRTNIFQYVLGLECLSEQLIELGVLETPLRPSWVSTSAPSRLVVLIEALFDAVGDQLSFQYAGTAAHKKYSSEGTGSLVNSGRELFISLSRHYSSAFTDNDKQNALNLFRGLYDAETEAACGTDVIDRFVHSRKTDACDEEKLDTDKPLRLGKPSTGYVTFAHMRIFGDPHPIQFNPVTTPIVSTPSSSRRASIFG